MPPCRRLPRIALKVFEIRALAGAAMAAPGVSVAVCPRKAEVTDHRTGPCDCKRDSTHLDAQVFIETPSFSFPFFPSFKPCHVAVSVVVSDCHPGFCSFYFESRSPRRELASCRARESRPSAEQESIDITRSAAGWLSLLVQDKIKLDA